MSLSRAAVIDCGASHLAIGLFTKAGRGRLKLEQFASEPLAAEPGHEDEGGEGLVRALGALRSRVKYRGPVAVVLPGHLVLTKFIRTPRVDAAKREKVVRFEAQQNIPYALNDVVWDHAVTGETDLDLEVMLCAAKLDAVETLCRALEQAGFIPQALLPPAPALGAAVRAVTASSASALALSIGARSTTLLLSEPARQQSRTLTLGGQTVTQVLVESQDCDFAEAEALKLSDRSQALVAPAMEAFALRLAQEITRSMLHFRRQSASASPGEVWLTGGGARLTGLGETLAAKLNIPVRTFDPLQGIEIAHTAAAGDPAGHAATLAELVGAAQIRLLDTATALNLLPPRLRRQETTRRRQPWLFAAIALTVAALVPPLWHYRSLALETQRKSAEVAAVIAPLRAREAQNRANLQRLEETRRQLAALQSVHGRRGNWVGLLADLQERLVKVEDVWLERMQLAPSPGEPGAPLRIAISGRMLDKTNPLANVSPDIYQRVTALLGSIVDSPYVSAVENERFDNRQPGILHFDFVLVADPARPL